MKVKKFKQFPLKVLRCEARAFPVVRLYHKSAIFFTPRNTRMRMNQSMNLDTWLAAILLLGETFLASSIIAYRPLAVCLQQRYARSKAAVPVRRKTCERCDLVFPFKRRAEQ